MEFKDSVLGTVVVAALLCIFCSVLVSGSAVYLRPIQNENKALDMKKNLLLASGLLENSKAEKPEIEEAFSSIKTLIIDLETGKEDTEIDVDSFNAKKAARDPETSKVIDPNEDIADIKRRALHSRVYLGQENGRTNLIVLPVHGKGLWSTMYGFLALDNDTKTIKGLGFYSHGETPGLGAEIDNPKWIALWPGKILMDEEFEPQIEVVKGSVNPANKDSDHQIDGLSGATITSRGVQYLVNYWTGDDGFGPFLKRFRAGEFK